jgi:hypothetical protein
MSAPAMERFCLSGKFPTTIHAAEKFCGYENSAFQAKNTLEYRNIHHSRSFQFTG